MLTATSFCIKVNEIIRNLKVDKILFSNVYGIFYLHNSKILKIDYHPYYISKISKKLKTIYNVYNAKYKLRLLDNLCEKIIKHSLSSLGSALVINNVPIKKQNGEIIDRKDIYNLFSNVGNISVIYKLSSHRYIVKFKDKNDNLYVSNLIDNCILEGNLIQSNIINK